MTEQYIGQRRSRDMRVLAYCKRLAQIAVRDREDSESAALVLVLLEEYRQGVALRGCTVEDFLRTARETQPGGSVLDLLDPLPDEHTPAERPSALEAEARRRGLWERLLRKFGLRL